MKKIILLFLIIPWVLQAQNYIKSADSCFKERNYACAGIFYDRYLGSDNSNGIAQRALHSWALSGDRDKTFSALHVFATNNYANGVIEFSQQLLSDSSLAFIKQDARWNDFIQGVMAMEANFKQQQQQAIDSALAIQRELESRGLLSKLDFSRDNAAGAFEKIATFNDYPFINRRYVSMQFKITDSLRTSFLVVLPENYDSHTSYPLLFFLHGAVFYNTGYPAIASASDTSGWNRFYTKYAGDVIMVYPRANKRYNWMYPDDGFFMVPGILKQVKQVINIDDNRVFITGHSNGATGSFSYLVKQPSAFAGFYGFNTRPRVETGGTYIKNILNRSFFNVSTDSDYYYPPSANDSLSALMKTISADYQDHRYRGFPHWFPQFDQSEPVYKLLFADLANRKRNPFHAVIYWECDDAKYGLCDWLQITSLDTTGKKAPWHQNQNFEIRKWVDAGNNKNFFMHDTLLPAFKYVKRSAAIRGSFKNNVFFIETSNIKSFSISLSPRMVDFKKPVTVILNGKLYCKQKVSYSKEYMIKSFLSNLDRSAVWVNNIIITI